MKFPSFGPKKTTDPKAPAKPAPADKLAAVAKKQAPKPAKVSSVPVAPDSKKQIVTGFVFIAAAFVGSVILLYLTVNAQSAKEIEVQKLNERLTLLATQKEVLDKKSEALQKEIGRVLDIDKVVEASQKVHGGKEADRKEGSMWIDRKSGSYLVTLGALNGVGKGNRLAVYDGDSRFSTVKVTTALDVVAYVEPVDKDLKDFLKNYYTVRSE